MTVVILATVSESTQTIPVTTTGTTASPSSSDLFILQGKAAALIGEVNIRSSFY